MADSAERDQTAAPICFFLSLLPAGTVEDDVSSRHKIFLNDSSPCGHIYRSTTLSFPMLWRFDQSALGALRSVVPVFCGPCSVSEEAQSAVPDCFRDGCRYPSPPD